MKALYDFNQDGHDYTLLELEPAKNESATIAVPADLWKKLEKKSAFANVQDQYVWDTLMGNSLLDHVDRFLLGIPGKAPGFFHDNLRDGIAAHRTMQVNKSLEIVPESETHYLMGKAEGVQQEWYTNGSLKFIARHHNGVAEGAAENFYPAAKNLCGPLMEIKYFTNGKSVAIPANASQKIPHAAHEWPSFTYMRFSENGELTLAQSNQRKPLHDGALKKFILNYQKQSVYTLAERKNPVVTVAHDRLSA